MRRAGAWVFLLATPALAQPQFRTFLSPIDDSQQPYALYVPKDYTASKRYPLVISLHGPGSNHRLDLALVFGFGYRAAVSTVAARYPVLPDIEFLVASPLARGTMGYQGIAERDVYDVLADVKKRYSVDENRIYLAGISIGGGGALWLGLTRADLWAAIAAVCPTSTAAFEDLAGNALHVPIRIFHGDRDPTAPVENSRRWNELLLAAGVRAEYTEFPHVRHNSWEHAYKNGAIFDWFSKFRRVVNPDRVRLSTRQYKYGSAYWVEIDAMATGELASIDASFTAPNTMQVTTANVEGFTLRLGGHPKFNAARPLALVIDGTKVGALRGVLSFSKHTGTWKPGKFVLSSTAKKLDLEGPLGEALSGRHIYVFGTADSPGAAEFERRKQVASEAATWSTPRTPLQVSFRVVPDRDVSEADIRSSDLILFGNRETNLLIRKFADRLPLALNPGAADYGLVFVASSDGRYIVVNSGLPFWTGADETDRFGAREFPLAWRVLKNAPDYLLFKGSLANVVAEGYFDREWRISAEQWSALQSVTTASGISPAGQ